MALGATVVATLIATMVAKGQRASSAPPSSRRFARVAPIESQFARSMRCSPRSISGKIPRGNAQAMPAMNTRYAGEKVAMFSALTLVHARNNGRLWLASLRVCGEGL